MTDTVHQLPYPPPWQDMPTLCAHICASPNTVDKWVKDGILPAPHRRGGKQLWKWAEVDAYLSNGGQATDPVAERIKNATRKAQEEGRAGH